MVVIPAGRFVMGSPDHELDRRISEGPHHEVIIRVPFAVSRFEVTFEQWDACVAASACARATDAWGRGEMPVVNVSWDDAKQYVSWLSRSTGREYRLPTETEWEYAARAGATSRYAWGDEPGADNANCNGCSDKWSLQTAPVGSFKPNAFGLNDMHGNVWEWTEDTWHDSYYGRFRMDRGRSRLSDHSRCFPAQRDGTGSGGDSLRTSPQGSVRYLGFPRS